MNKTEFQQLITATANSMMNASQLYQMVSGTIPELPENCQYMGMQEFALKHVAALCLTMAVGGRGDVPRLFELFPPLDLIKCPANLPSVVPVAAGISCNVEGCYSIFPATFNSFFFGQSDGRTYGSNISWYYSPFPGSLPDIRVYAIAVIQNDPARVYENEEYNIPDGIKTSTPISGVDEANQRCVNVQWENMSVDDWARNFCVPVDEWTEIIGEQ